MFKIKFAAEKPKKADSRGHSLLPDYTVYELTLIQKTLAIAVGGLLLFGVGYLFIINGYCRYYLCQVGCMHLVCCVIIC